MSHITFVSISGFRVRENEMLELGMRLPGLRDRAKAIGALPALGLLTLAGMTPRSWDITYHEPPVVNTEFVDLLKSENPSLVAISFLTASTLEAYWLCTQLRSMGIKVALGGLHVTACPDEAKENADCIVVGDGEAVWLELLRDLSAEQLEARYDGIGRFSLSNSPIPRYDLIENAGKRPRLTLQTQRGCPFACEFCAASRLLGKFREKPVSHIEKELIELCKLDPKPIIELADDNSFAGRRDSSELLRVLSKSNARYFTEADWRLGERPEILKDLAASGCLQVLVGIESMYHIQGEEAELHNGFGAKSASFERILEAIENIQNSGVAVNACFIIGSDGESIDSIKRLGDFLESSPFAEVQLTLLTPFPGTALYDRLKSEGRLLVDRDWSHYTLFDVCFEPANISVAELENAFRELVQRTFGVEQSRRRQAIRKEIWKKRISRLSK